MADPPPHPSSPPPPPAPSAPPGPSGKQLTFGQVVRIEVRASGEVQPLSHEYPVNAGGSIKMPMLESVRANGLTVEQLADAVQRELARGFFRSPTVNVTLTSKVVAYGALITEARLHFRLLDSVGTVEKVSGEYPVRADGNLNLPHLGQVRANGRRLDEVEAEIQDGFRKDYIRTAIVHLTRQHLD